MVFGLRSDKWRWPWDSCLNIIVIGAHVARRSPVTMAKIILSIPLFPLNFHNSNDYMAGIDAFIDIAILVRWILCDIELAMALFAYSQTIIIAYKMWWHWSKVASLLLLLSWICRSASIKLITHRWRCPPHKTPLQNGQRAVKLNKFDIPPGRLNGKILIADKHSEQNIDFFWLGWQLHTQWNGLQCCSATHKNAL